MTRTATISHPLRGGRVRPSLIDGTRPEYFWLENLLEARRGSMFPTNGAGYDEDVNIYLAGLLAGLVTPRTDGLAGGGHPLLVPPGKTKSRRDRAEFYRANADHRLLYLGLFGRGDGLRRQPRWRGLADAEARTRDLQAGRTCYEAAANLLRDRSLSSALVTVWDKLARDFDDYVHVLAALATRRLGLGAHLTDSDLTRLVPPPAAAVRAEVESLLAEAPAGFAQDALLDLWSAYRKNPEPDSGHRLRDLAAWLGVDLPTA